MANDLATRRRGAIDP